MVDGRCDFWCPSLLGILGQRIFQCERRLHTSRRERLPLRTLSSPAELGGKGLSQPYLLQEARERWALRGLGTATPLVRGRARGLQNAAPRQDDGAKSVIVFGLPCRSCAADILLIKNQRGITMNAFSTSDHPKFH